MTNILLEMSLAGALLIVVTILIRALVMHKLPKKTFLVLWAIVLIRLLVPVQVPSPTSIFNLLGVAGGGSSTLPIVSAPSNVNLAPQASPPIWQFATGNVSTYTTRLDTPDAAVSSMAATPLRPAISLLSLAYPTGIAILTIYFVLIYVKHRKEFMISLPVENAFIQSWLAENKLLRPISVRVWDKVDAPLTYGIFRPVILLPKSTNWANISELEYILAHELVHIRRLDALTKLIMLAALCIHWFNPIVWIMCFLFNRDMEISCDETVVNYFGETSKHSYALTLIGLAERGSHFPALLHNNFSKHAIEERITAIMKIKTTFIGTLVALILVATTVVVFATTQTGDDDAAATSYTQANSLNEYNNNATSTDTAYANAANSLATDALEQTTQGNFYVEIAEFFGREPGANELTAEEAAQVAADILERLFDADLNGETIVMHFFEAIEGGIRRGQDISWSLGLVQDWADQLGMTVDEILDYVREKSTRDYTFEVGLDVDSLASVVGLTSEEFMFQVLTVYIYQRSTIVVEGWAYELGMTVDEFFDYMMEGNSLEGFADYIGVDVEQFVHTAGSVWNVAMTTWNMREQPNMWTCVIMGGNPYWALFSITIDAQTGALINASHSPWATEAIEMPHERDAVMFVPAVETEPTIQQNYEYARLAMDMAQELNIFENPIQRAKITLTVNSLNQATGEMTPVTGVVVECVNGEMAQLNIDRCANNEPVLSFVNTLHVCVDYPQFNFEWVLN